jgi:cytochrome c oxidase assembly factor CtaG
MDRHVQLLYAAAVDVDALHQLLLLLLLLAAFVHHRCNSPLKTQHRTTDT